MEIMSKGTFATVAALVLLLCVPLSAAGKVPTSRTDPFLKVVREKVSVEVARFEMVKKQIDWDALQKEVDKAADADERKRRQEYVDLWKVLAERHDHGCMCSKPFVFEDEVFDLLGGSLSHMTSRDRSSGLTSTPPAMVSTS